MASKNYLKTVEVAKLTGRPYNEILSLVNKGVLTGYKTRRGRWRLKTDDVVSYFGVQITNPSDIQDKPETVAKPPKASIQNNDDKLICGHTARKYLNCRKAEFENLVGQGVILAHRDDYMRWKVSKKSVLDYIKNTQTDAGFSYVADEEHYTEVFRRMTKVKHSLKIATANLKNFNVTVEADGGEETLRLCDFFLSLVERGVGVQVVCMKPFGFYLYARENCPRLLEHPLFELRYNGSSHMKVFVFDDECAYIGSANITSAAIGKRASGNRNHEAGMLVWDESMTEAPLRHFERVWNDPDNLKHTWKRFARMAKEFLRKE